MKLALPEAFTSFSHLELVLTMNFGEMVDFGTFESNGQDTVLDIDVYVWVAGFHLRLFRYAE